MVGWHLRLSGHGFGWTLGVGDGERGLACCSSWGHKESDMTERLNWTELMVILCFTFWGISQLLSINVWGFQLFLILKNTCYWSSFFFLIIIKKIIIAIPVRIKDLEFPIREDTWVIFQMYHFLKGQNFGPTWSLFLQHCYSGKCTVCPHFW